MSRRRKTPSKSSLEVSSLLVFAALVGAGEAFITPISSWAIEHAGESQRAVLQFENLNETVRAAVRANGSFSGMQRANCLFVAICVACQLEAM